MATVQQVVDNVVFGLSTLFPALVIRGDADYRDDLDAFTPGVTGFRLRHQQEQAVSDSNQDIKQVSIEVEVIHRLLDRFDELAYVEGVMNNHMNQLLSPAWWRGISGVREVTSRPVNELDVSREGNIISYSVVVILAVVP